MVAHLSAWLDHCIGHLRVLVGSLSPGTPLEIISMLDRRKMLGHKENGTPDVPIRGWKIHPYLRRKRGS